MKEKLTTQNLFYVLLFSTAVFSVITVSAFSIAAEGNVINPEALANNTFTKKLTHDSFDALLEEDETVKEFMSRNPSLIQKLLESPLLQREFLSKVNQAENEDEKTEILNKYLQQTKKEEQAFEAIKAKSFTKPVIRLAPQAPTAPTPAVPTAPAAPNTGEVTSTESAQITSAIKAISNANNAEIQKQIAGAEQALKSADRVAEFVNKIVAVRQEIIKEFLALLEHNAPQAHTAFFENTPLIQQVIDGELSLVDIATQLNVTDEATLNQIKTLSERIPLQKRP